MAAAAALSDKLMQIPAVVVAQHHAARAVTQRDHPAVPVGLALHLTVARGVVAFHLTSLEPAQAEAAELTARPEAVLVRNILCFPAVQAALPVGVSRPGREQQPAAVYLVRIFLLPNQRVARRVVAGMVETVQMPPRPDYLPAMVVAVVVRLF